VAGRWGCLHHQHAMMMVFGAWLVLPHSWQSVMHALLEPRSSAGCSPLLLLQGAE
jgi:hypothetical protein